MKLKSKMILSMCMVFILFILASGVGLVSMRESQTRFETFLDRDVALLQLKNDIYAQGLQMGQAIRNVILEPANKTSFKNYEMASRDFDSALEKAIELAAYDPESQAILKEIAALRKDQKPIQTDIIAIAATDTTKATEMTNTRETPLWRKIKAKLLDLIQKRSAALQDTRSQTLSNTWQRISLSTGLVVVALLFGIILSAWLIRSITRPLEYAVQIAKRAASGDLSLRIEVNSNDETGELLRALREMNDNLRETVTEVRNSTQLITNAADEIADGNLDLATRTEAQGSSLERTTQTMNHLTGTVQQNAEYASQANTLAETASTVAVRGGQVVTEVVQTMGEISQASHQIFDIISLIDGIAFQTNILALNAAVEAARAGEQGRGFAVVASEVRMLARRSADAAREIKGLINNSVDKVDVGSKLVEQAGQTMTEIVSSIQRVNDIMTDITQATTEQTAGIHQVNDAIQQIDAATQQNSALVQQVSAVASSLQERGQELTDLVSRFTLEEAPQTTV